MRRLSHSYTLPAVGFPFPSSPHPQLRSLPPPPPNPRPSTPTRRRERIETLLEIHHNALLRTKTATYLENRARQLEDIISEAGLEDDADADDPLTWLFDCSKLSYRDRDDLVDALRNCRSRTSYDMAKGWNTRTRRYYGT